MDGVLYPPTGDVSIWMDPDRSGTLLSMFEDGGQAAWNTWPAVGDWFMTITLGSRPSFFRFSHGRPLYGPGWRIRENGVDIVIETSNRGTALTPAPVTYDTPLP